jgi:hypothetical protein
MAEKMLSIECINISRGQNYSDVLKALNTIQNNNTIKKLH